MRPNWAEADGRRGLLGPLLADSGTAPVRPSRGKRPHSKRAVPVSPITYSL